MKKEPAPFSSVEQILLLARTYAKAENVPLSTVSWRVFGDGKKLLALAEGADLETRRAARAIDWFANGWPKNAVWPEKVTRPEFPVPPPLKTKKAKK